MIVTPLRPVGRNWSTLSFASTLYLKPILDLLLAEIPSSWQADLRLGLQEALVNAAKHGNALDPSKQVTIQFSIAAHKYWWIITDQGSSPEVDCFNPESIITEIPCYELECGRGLYIVHQIFDQVNWDARVRQLHLCKHIKHYSIPLLQ